MLTQYRGTGGFVRCEQISERSWWVSLVRIQRRSRGRGYARQLMARVLHDADVERVTLRLCVPGHTYSDEMTPDQLAAWYTRLGFKLRGYNLIRRPRRRKGV